MTYRAIDPLRIPANFWERDDVTEALRDRHIGRLLKLLQHYTGASQTKIGIAVDMSQATVSNIINSRKRRQVTSLDVFTRIADGLHMPDHARITLGLAPVALQSVRAHPAEASTFDSEHRLLRGRPETTSQVEPAVDPWELAKVVTRSSLAPALVDRFERVAHAQVTRYPHTPPDHIWPTVRQELTRVSEALSQRQTLKTQRRLVGVLGILAGVAGNLAIDRGRPASAFEFFDLSQMAGAEADDPDLTAWASALASIELYVTGNAMDAATYLDEAAALARLTSSARRRSWIAALRARAHAASDNNSIARTAINEAQALLEDADTPQGTDFFDQDRLDGLTGRAYLLLGDSRQAADLVSRAIERRPLSEAKGRALLVLDKANCLVIEDDPLGACAVIHNALDLANGQIVRPILLRAHEVTSAIAGGHPVAEVQALTDRLSEIARDASR